jgi:calcium/proton exchanger cax
VLTTVIGEQSWLLVGCVATLPAAVLALTVTVIEAALLLSLLVAAGAGMATLPRDTVYATVMIITTGVVGLCTMIGGLTHREQLFRVDRAGGGLAALIVLAVVTLVLPDFTITTGVGTYSRGQSLFVAVVSAMLWGIFAFVQTIRHRDYFLPHDDHARPDEHALPPSRWQTTLSLVLLLVALVAVVGLAKVLSHPLGEFVGSWWRWWCSCPRPGPRFGQRMPTGSRAARTSRSAPRSRRSASRCQSSSSSPPLTACRSFSDSTRRTSCSS